MKMDVDVSVTRKITARARQIGAMLDVPLEETTTRHWHHDLPLHEKPWNVGLIVGPSGSGKSQLANAVWPGRVVTAFDWPDDLPLVDGFPRDLGIKDVAALLSGVGLGSVPAWMRPFWTLSNGEAFRATIARALAESDQVVVVDEFSSVVDRQVAKVASHTVQKAVRRQGRQLIAVTCHTDVAEWLQPDWTYEIAVGEFAWGSVQPRPRLALDVYRCPRSLWRMFAPHHYLSGQIKGNATCFAAYLNDRPVAFTSFIHFMHARTRNIKMGHRLVVLPDYQGLGISGALDDWLGEWLWARKFRYRNTVAHPAMIRFYSTSPRWREVGSKLSRGLVGSSPATADRTDVAERRRGQHEPRRLSTRSFEYCPETK
jgi:GNAT superfamily N-acetyltransferase